MKIITWNCNGVRARLSHIQKLLKNQLKKIMNYLMMSLKFMIHQQLIKIWQGKFREKKAEYWPKEN